MKRLAPWLAGIALLVPAWAQAAPDYGPTNRDWNGLTELVEVAALEGVELEVARSVDVDRLGPGDALFVLYPQRGMPVASLLDFLRGGGRMALADDFGEGRALLRRFGIERGLSTSAGATRLRESEALLVARPRVAHPLTEGIEAIVTNHPAALRHPELEPVLAYDDGPDAFVLSGTVGEGRLVAIADPSVFINQMLAIDGNRRFAAATLRFLAGGRADGRVILVSGDAELHGREGDDPAAGPVERMNDLLRSAAHAEIPALGLTVAALVLCGIFAAVASGAVALRGPYGAETILPPAAGGGGFSGWLRFYLDPARSRNLLHPTLMYKTELEAALATSLGLPERAGARALVAAVPAGMRAEASALLEELEALERGERAAGAAPRVRPRGFLRYVERGEALREAVEAAKGATRR